MLKHFHLGRRATFPFIFLGIVLLLFGAGYAMLAYKGGPDWAQSKSAIELLLAVVGIAAAFAHFLYSQHHQDTQTFVSLFEKFNTRYNGLNERLNAIVARPMGATLSRVQVDTLYDYFNLCAEEHLFYESGYIDERVWQAWLRGMKHFANDAAILRLWTDEIAAGSYYHFKLTVLDAVEVRSGHPVE